MSGLPEGYSFVEEELAPQELPPQLPEGYTLPEGYSFVEDAPDPMQELGEEAREVPGFIEKVGQDFDKRSKDVWESTVSYWGKDEIGLGEYITQLGGATAGAITDVAGRGFVEVGEALGEGLSLIVHDAVEEPVVEGMKSAVDWVANTEAGEAATQAVMQGYEAYTEWKKENPQDAKTFESVVNIGVLLAPVKVRKGQSPVPSFGRKATKLIAKGKRQPVKRTKQQIQNMLFPEKISPADVGRTKEVGVLRRAELQLNSIEKNMITNVMKIPEIKTGRSYLYNHNVINGSVKQSTARLMSDLEKYTNVVIHPRTVAARMKSGLDELLLEKSYITADETLAGQVANLVNAGMKVVEKHPANPAGLLAARREFDRVLRKQKPKVFDPKVANAEAEAGRVVRRAINDMINSSVKSENVAKRLAEQSTLYKAMDMLTPKVAADVGHGLGRVYQNLHRVLGVKMDLNRTVAVIGGTSAFAAAGGMYAGRAGGLVMAGAGALAVKGAQSAVMKKALGRTLKYIDTAIQTSTNPEMIKQLRADKILVQDLFELPVEELEKEDQ